MFVYKIVKNKWYKISVALLVMGYMDKINQLKGNTSWHVLKHKLFSMAFLFLFLWHIPMVKFWLLKGRYNFVLNLGKWYKRETHNDWESFLQKWSQAGDKNIWPVVWYTIKQNKACWQVYWALPVDLSWHVHLKHESLVRRLIQRERELDLESLERNRWEMDVAVEEWFNLILK